jgi:hypothetical protein
VLGLRNHLCDCSSWHAVSIPNSWLNVGKLPSWMQCHKVTTLGWIAAGLSSITGRLKKWNRMRSFKFQNGQVSYQIDQSPTSSKASAASARGPVKMGSEVRGR